MEQIQEGDLTLFRKLSAKEEATFRIWAREHPEEAFRRLADDSLGILHPVVRDEWKKMGLI